MEGNRDDAEKCAALANRALADGDIDRAIRLSKKSLRLFPNDAAEKILKKASGARSAPSGQGPHSPNNRRRAPAGSNNNKEQAEEKPCTPEQMEHVRRVLRAKTLYEVLGIGRYSCLSEFSFSGLPCGKSTCGVGERGWTVCRPLPRSRLFLGKR
mmetsp:Transcript_7287/g.32320  ORF Transcript_7287/g.32320 Transcript_7287/m.32320 type:complete len:155 (+) Transcript_7287:874-1338(+)